MGLLLFLLVLVLLVLVPQQLLMGSHHQQHVHLHHGQRQCCSFFLPRFTVPAVHLAFVWFFRHHDTTRAPSHTPPDHQLLPTPHSSLPRPPSPRPHLYANALLLLMPLLLLLLLLRVNANFADLHANVACTNIEVYCQSCRHSRWRVACPCWCCWSCLCCRCCCCCCLCCSFRSCSSSSSNHRLACWPGDHSWVSWARTVKQTQNWEKAKGKGFAFAFASPMEIGLGLLRVVQSIEQKSRTWQWCQIIPKFEN